MRRVIEQEIRDKVTDYYLDHLDVKKLKADTAFEKSHRTGNP